MLVGPTCGGKTTVRKILQRSLTLLESEEKSLEGLEHGQQKNVSLYTHHVPL